MKRNDAAGPRAVRPRWQRTCFVFLAIVCPLAAGTANASSPAATLNGRYVIAAAAPNADGLPGGGTVDVDPRRTTYTLNWRLDLGKSLRGIGLADGTDLIGASINTGGIAHGLAIYRRAEAGQRWLGQWITSIDSASIVGVMDFDADPKAPTLAGRHHFSGHRATTGNFNGTVTMYPQGEDFMLTFTTAGGATLYKGVGILRGERLVVAWSFGSSPALAVYERGAHGELNGRRLSLRSRGVLSGSNERLLPADTVVSATGPGTGLAKEKDAPQGKGAGAESAGLSASEPGAPAVKTTSYADLLARYGSAGWAERWLDRQLTFNEQRLLQLAVNRHRAGDPTTTTLGSRTVGQLIDEQRRLQPQ